MPVCDTYSEAQHVGSTLVVLPPGVAAERRLRGFKIDVLVHTGRIIVCHSETKHKEAKRVK